MIRSLAAISAVALVTAICSPGTAGDFSGSVKYVAGSEECLSLDGLDVCLVGAAPSRTGEIAVLVTLENTSGEQRQVTAADFAMAGSRDGEQWVARTVEEFDYIMRRILRYEAKTAKAAGENMISGSTILEPAERREVVLRYYLKAIGTKSSTAKKPRLSGERYVSIADMRLPTTLTLSMKGKTLGTCRLAWLDFGGGNGEVVFSLFGLERWDTVEAWRERKEYPEGLKWVALVFVSKAGHFLMFDDGRFIVAERADNSVCRGRVRSDESPDANTSAIRFTNTDDYQCKGPRLLTNRSRLSIRLTRNGCELVGPAGEPWPAQDAASCPP